MENILKKMADQKLVGALSYEPLVRRHPNLIWWFFCHLINFCEKSIKNQMAEGGHFEKVATQKRVGAISYEPLIGLHLNLMW